MKFGEQNNSNINYILYNLLKYFPLSTFEFKEKKYDFKIRQAIKLLRVIKIYLIKKLRNILISSTRYHQEMILKVNWDS